VVIDVPQAASDSIDTKVVLQVAGEVAQQKLTVQPDKSGALLLTADVADSLDDPLKVETVKRSTHIGSWINPTAKVRWLVSVPADGKYKISFDAASEKKTSLTLSAGESTATLAIDKPTGDYKKFKKYQAGQIELKAGRKVVIVVAPVAQGWKPANLHAVQLERAE